jgi:hypothetical protein
VHGRFCGRAHPIVDAIAALEQQRHTPRPAGKTEVAAICDECLDRYRETVEYESKA